MIYHVGDQSFERPTHLHLKASLRKNVENKCRDHFNKIQVLVLYQTVNRLHFNTAKDKDWFAPTPRTNLVKGSFGCYRIFKEAPVQNSTSNSCTNGGNYPDYNSNAVLLALMLSLSKVYVICVTFLIDWIPTSIKALCGI